jgi:hypothetical protein
MERILFSLPTEAHFLFTAYGTTPNFILVVYEHYFISVANRKIPHFISVTYKRILFPSHTFHILFRRMQKYYHANSYMLARTWSNPESWVCARVYGQKQVGLALYSLHARCLYMVQWFAYTAAFVHSRAITDQLAWRYYDHKADCWFMLIAIWWLIWHAISTVVSEEGNIPLGTKSALRISYTIQLVFRRLKMWNNSEKLER